MSGREKSLRAAGILALIALALGGGCVERTITVRSNPPGARVYLDDIDHGETPVTFEFNFYGERELVLRKDNYATHHEAIQVSPPIYSRFPIDTFFDLLWPFRITEDHGYEAVLQPVVVKPDEEKLIFRAQELRDQMVSPPSK